MSVIVVGCVDKRMPSTWPALLQLVGVSGEAYHLNAVGGSATIEAQLNAIGETITMTGTNELYLWDHIGCKKFEKDYGRLDPVQERQLHIKRLREAAKILHNRFPNLTKIHLNLLNNVTDKAIGTSFEKISEG